MKYVSPIYANELISTEDIMAASPVVIVKNEISAGSGISYVDENGEEKTLTSGIIGNASTFFGKLY